MTSGQQTSFDPQSNTQLLLDIAEPHGGYALFNLMSRYRNYLVNLAVRAGLSSKEAWDVTEETFLAIADSADTYQPERADPSSWILTTHDDLITYRLLSQGIPNKDFYNTEIKRTYSDESIEKFRLAVRLFGDEYESLDNDINDISRRTEYAKKLIDEEFLGKEIPKLTDHVSWPLYGDHIDIYYAYFHGVSIEELSSKYKLPYYRLFSIIIYALNVFRDRYEHNLDSLLVKYSERLHLENSGLIPRVIVVHRQMLDKISRMERRIFEDISSPVNTLGQMYDLNKQETNSERFSRVKMSLEHDEVIESLELDGVNVERITEDFHTSGYRSRPFVSPSALVESGFSRYTPSRIVQLATSDRISEDIRIQHIKISGRTYLGGIGVEQLMDHEERSLAGKLTPWAARAGEYRGGGRKPKPRTLPVVAEKDS